MTYPKYDGHGERVRLYGIHRLMLRRCNDIKDKDYKNYGKRGIIVCKEWADNYDSFAKWAYENNYSDELTLDRIDVNGIYEPKNCRWSTIKQQSYNKRETLKIKSENGEVHTLDELMEITGLNYSTIHQRIKKGWTYEQIIDKDIVSIRGTLYTIEGETNNLSTWCKKYKVNYEMVKRRIQRGWDIVGALKTPKL